MRRIYGEKIAKQANLHALTYIAFEEQGKKYNNINVIYNIFITFA